MVGFLRQTVAKQSFLACVKVPLLGQTHVLLSC